MARGGSNKIQQALQMPTLQEIRDLVSDYELELDSAEQTGEGAWRLVTDRGVRCLHLVKYSEARLLFIHSVMEHLAAKGLRVWLRMIRNRHGQAFTVLESGLGLYLTDWLPGRPCSLSRTDQAQDTARLLARLHIGAEGFQPLEGSVVPVAWGQWPAKLKARLRDLQDFREAARLKGNKNKFARSYLTNIDYFMEQGSKALTSLEGPEYDILVEKERETGVFCFRAIDSGQVIKQAGELVLSTYDYCICDLRVYDLARLLHKVGWSNHWDWGKTLSVLEAYEEIRRLSPEEKKVLLAWLTFPRKFWLYGRRYFLQTGGDNTGMSDWLKRSLRHEDKRAEFLDLLEQQSGKD